MLSDDSWWECKSAGSIAVATACVPSGDTRIPAQITGLEHKVSRRSSQRRHVSLKAKRFTAVVC